MQPATAPEFDDIPTGIVEDSTWNKNNYKTKGVMTVDDYHIVFVRRDHPVITILRAGNMIDESTLIDGYYKLQESVFNAGCNLLDVDESEEAEEEQGVIII